MHHNSENSWNEDLRSAEAARGDYDSAAAAYIRAFNKGYRVNDHLPDHIKRVFERASAEFNGVNLSKYILHTRRPVFQTSSESEVLPKPAEFSLELMGGAVYDERDTPEVIGSSSSRHKTPHLSWLEDNRVNHVAVSNIAYRQFDGRHDCLFFPRDIIFDRLKKLKQYGCVAHNYSSLEGIQLQRQFFQWQNDIHGYLSEAVARGKCRPDLHSNREYSDWRKFNNIDSPQSVSS